MTRHNQTLEIRDPKGSYRQAKDQEIIDQAKELLKIKLFGDSLTSPKQSMDFMITQLGDLKSEVFGCLFLSTDNRVISFEILFRGSINNTAVHPREVIKKALAVNANAVIFAHNHPSGDTKPSDADITMTKQLKNILAVVDVRVLDHIIVGGDQCSSMAELGHL